MDMRISPIQRKIPLESDPLKSRILERRLAIRVTTPTLLLYHVYTIYIYIYIYIYISTHIHIHIYLSISISLSR